MPNQLFTPGAGPAGLLKFDFQPAVPEQPLQRVIGVTRDANGVALPACTVKLFRTSDNMLVDQTVSDASGNYILGSGSPIETYYVVAYLAGSPDVAGTTKNNLVSLPV